MNTRREFIKTLLGTAAVGAAAPLLSGCHKAAAPVLHLDEIGLQISTIKNMMKNDYQSALRTVAEIGYKTVEMGTPAGTTIPEFKAFLKEIGLNPLSGGTSMAQLKSDLDTLLPQAAELGNQFYVCFWPWTDSGENKNVDDWKRVSDDLNAIGAKVKDAGMRFLYHNHNIEFVSTDGVLPFDVLIQRTDPALVNFEIDLYWVKKGGYDPIPFMVTYPGRFPVWHVKDMDNTEDKDFACVGQGIIDFPAIFAKSKKAGMEHVLVEHDRPQDELACIQTSYEYLSNMTYTLD